MRMTSKRINNAVNAALETVMHPVEHFFLELLMLPYSINCIFVNFYTCKGRSLRSMKTFLKNI